MISMKYKPYFLPQVHAPYDYVLQKLDDENINYSVVEVDPNELNPMQGITFSDEVGDVNVDDMSPIWISLDMGVADGHHRFTRALIDNILIKNGLTFLSNLIEISIYRQKNVSTIFFV